MTPRLPRLPFARGDGGRLARRGLARGAGGELAPKHRIGDHHPGQRARAKRKRRRRGR